MSEPASESESPAHPRTRPASDGEEHALAARVVSALLRENYGGLAGNVARDENGAALRLPGTSRMLPLEPDGFVADLRVPAGAALTLDEVRDAVAVLAGTRDAAGAAAFDEECRRTLAEARLRASRSVGSDAGQPEPGQAGAPGADSAPGADGAWTGAGGQLRYDALAAALPHPVYPASPCRLGLTDADLLACAPEFSPGFELRWAAVPKSLVTRSYDTDPAWWPTPEQVGLDPRLGRTHALFPVHPLTARSGAVAVAPRPYLTVRPTLSVRTVAVVGHPEHHLKLPLPASTLGLRNRRSIVPGTLADGALVGRALAAIGLPELLIADETRYAHTGRSDLGYLLRRFSPGLDGTRVVPIAALTARAPGGQRTVFEELAGSAGVLAFARAYFRLVFGVAVRLLVRHGIALESHQQNAALVLAPDEPLRLLVKDFDGTLLRRDRVPAARDLADSRMATDRDEALADVFVTITAHLCVGAVAFGLARAGAAPVRELLAAARRALTDALEAEDGADSLSMKLLRVRVLEADRLTGKSMITAGTLTAKEHSGAADVNKFYETTGPNYLKGNE